MDGLRTYDRYVTTEDGANNSGPPKTGTTIGGQGKQQLCLGHANGNLVHTVPAKVT